MALDSETPQEPERPLTLPEEKKMPTGEPEPPPDEPVDATSIRPKDSIVATSSIPQAGVDEKKQILTGSAEDRPFARFNPDITGVEPPELLALRQHEQHRAAVNAERAAIDERLSQSDTEEVDIDTAPTFGNTTAVPTPGGLVPANTKEGRDWALLNAINEGTTAFRQTVARVLGKRRADSNIEHPEHPIVEVQPPNKKSEPNISEDDTVPPGASSKE